MLLPHMFKKLDGRSMIESIKPYNLCSGKPKLRKMIDEKFICNGI